jgi:hypothetical protein
MIARITPTTSKMTPMTKRTWAKAKVGTSMGSTSPRRIRTIPRMIMVSLSDLAQTVRLEIGWAG